MILIQPIRNPSVTLYPFHIRDDFDQGYHQQAHNAKSLWKKLAIVLQEFNSENAQKEENPLIESDPVEGHTFTIRSF